VTRGSRSQPRPGAVPSTVNVVDRADPSPGTNRRVSKPLPEKDRLVDGGPQHREKTVYTPRQQ